MKKIISIMIKDRSVFSFALLSLTLFFFGITIIFESFIDIQSIDNNYKNQKILKLSSNFKYRNDISIREILKKNNLNNLHENQSRDLNFLNLKNVTLNSQISKTNLQIMPDDFSSIQDLKTRKEKFIILILPLIVQENQKIRNIRKKLTEINEFLVTSKTLYKIDQKFIENLANKYNIEVYNKHKVDVIKSLLESVDEIPNSIVLAQAANESGWGTSRFAQEYNALFGEYTFNVNNGVVPILRNEGEQHLIKYFSNINESVGSYFKNLNTHPAYKKFREARINTRNNNIEIDPMMLVQHLEPYAEDKNYVETIKSIIKSNRLLQFDSVKTIVTKS